MAEEGSVYELEGLEKQLQSLLSCGSSNEVKTESKTFCSDFCRLVEEYTSRWQTPLPRLKILERALCCFTQASTCFASDCDHVLRTLSSLALSVFELLLFFEPKDFHREPLKRFTATFQECHLALARHQNVHLLQVERLVRGGGPWVGPVLQAILSESSLPQSEADGYISAELPVFFELRVRYLLSRKQRLGEAAALAKRCSRHPTAGRHLFFLQVYLTWLFKTSQHDILHKEVADLNGKDAVYIICSLECEEKDELLLALSRAFLSQLLRRGDMYYLHDLVFIWSKLHSRLKTSKEALLEEGRQLMLSATNINSVFPFIRAILQELGEDGIQFCVELCANALESHLPCDVATKSLIYKTIAGLLPNDLEVCRACALLVFFLESTVEAYKIVYLLYMQPDQEYHVEYTPIRNHVRFETLQILKKDLYFDPEFWNLIALRTNCLKLMSEKVVSADLEEIMEDKWIHHYCAKEPALQARKSLCRKGSKAGPQGAAKKRRCKDEHDKEDNGTASKRLRVGPGKTRLNVDHTVKKKCNQGSRPLRDASSEPLRRSFWQLDRLQDNVGLRRTTRLSEKNPPKRRIIKPKWLVEDSGTLEENNTPPKIKRHGFKHQKHLQTSGTNRPETSPVKNNAKGKTSENCHLMMRENKSKHQKGFSLDSHKPATPPQVILELSLPDNELMGTFIEDTCNRQRGFPQVLLYKPTVKLPATPQPVKAAHRKEVILRARDAPMFVQQLHCYARRQKGKGSGSNIQGSVSTITRSSMQGSPPKDQQRQLGESHAVELKGGVASRTPAAAKMTESQVLEKVLQANATKAVSRKTALARELSQKSAAEMKVSVDSQTLATMEVAESPVLDKVLQAKTLATARQLCEESAVEMKVTIASQTPAAAKVTRSPGTDKAQTAKDASQIATSQPSTVNANRMRVTDKIPPVSNTANIADNPESSQDVILRDGKQQLELRSLFSQAEAGEHPVAQAKPEALTAVKSSILKGQVLCENDTGPGGTVVTVSKAEATCRRTDQESINDISSLTLVTEMVTKLSPEELARECQKEPGPEDSTSVDSKAGSKPLVPDKLRTTYSCCVPELGAPAVADVQRMKEDALDIAPETPENSDPAETPLESEESKLEYCCTFCNKVFKGSRVVAHAMFHYRKDECMFCGTTFKDDLLAMMHLSNHIEKLKKIKESAGNAQENWVADAKDIAAPKTTNVSRRRSSGRQRSLAVSSSTLILPDSPPLVSRKLRSNDKPEHGPSLQGSKQKPSKSLNSKTSGCKANGHIGKKKALDRPKKDTINLEAKQPHAQQGISQESTSHGAKNPRLQENIEAPSEDSAEDQAKETESLRDGNVEMQEKVRCPVDGCAWITDLSKNRVALLYHALADHDGEVKPLELAFRVGNSRCSICMRVLWSFEHFQHHVERHKLSPRHPCPHQGCAARFKTGMEMRRHARRHSPLQAVCCLPGCSELFICLWALNLHEREHYASKPTKLDKNTHEHTDGKQPDHKTKDGIATTTVNKNVIMKAARKSRGQYAHKSSLGKAPSRTTVRTSLFKSESTNRSETKDSHVLKNLSNKDTSAQPTIPNLRLRQTSRKVKGTNSTPAALKSRKVISSSLLKHNIKMRHKLKKKQVKVITKGPERRGRPPKSKKDVRDENTKNGDVVKEKTDLEKDQTLASPPTASDTLNVSNGLKEENSRQVQHNTSTATGTAKGLNQLIATTSADKTQKSTPEKMRKLQKASQTAFSVSSKSKKHTVTNGKANTEIVKKRCPVKGPESVSKKLAESNCFVQQVEAKEAAAEAAAESSADGEGKAKAENRDWTQDGSSNAVPAGPFDRLNGTVTPPTTPGKKRQNVAKDAEKSKKLRITKKEGREEKCAPAALSNSGKTNKKHKNMKKKGHRETVQESRPCKDACTSALKTTAKSGSEDQQVKAEVECSLGLEGDAKVEASDATLHASGSASGLIERTSPPAASEENVQTVTKESKMSNVTKGSDPNRANKKDISEEGDTKILKKKCKEDVPSETKALAEAEEAVDSSGGEKGKTAAETPQSAIGSPGYTVIMNGQVPGKHGRAAAFKEALAEHYKRPYMRLPPTAYLDEKYITMPKRRKEMSFLQASPRSPPREPAKVAAVPRRQRCANCFATFNSPEDLQGHLQLRKCSNLFGFDSDDEGNG